MLRDFFDLFCPVYCMACSNVLVRGEEMVCTSCAYELPMTNSHQSFHNVVAQKFLGKLPITHAMALYQFNKRGKVQRLLHHLKYKHKPYLGKVLGIQYGSVLREMPWHRDFDWIIPVPLHPHRLWERGYNQSEPFAQGLSEVLAVPWSKQYLQRIRASAPQARNRQSERFASVEGAFFVTSPSAIADQHLLLVDDVVTTGATLSACGTALLRAGAKEISVATIAVTE